MFFIPKFQKKNNNLREFSRTSIKKLFRHTLWNVVARILVLGQILSKGEKYDKANKQIKRKMKYS